MELVNKNLVVMNRIFLAMGTKVVCDPKTTQDNVCACIPWGSVRDKNMHISPSNTSCVLDCLFECECFKVRMFTSYVKNKTSPNPIPYAPFLLHLIPRQCANRQNDFFQRDKFIRVKFARTEFDGTEFFDCLSF